MRVRLLRLVSLFTLVIFLSGLYGCNTVAHRIDTANNQAVENGFSKKTYHSPLFSIVTYQKLNTASLKTATVFIEGDGLAWITRRQVSTNPTPVNPVALELAISDHSDAVIYLARPCQYLDLEKEKNCQAEYWTSHRASEEIITTFNDVLDQIRVELQLEHMRLVGYSGGATIAAILAARRDDIIDLRTVAGNLDIEKFSEIHNVSRLHGSINPISFAKKLIHIPQLHIYSTDDSIVTPELIDSYMHELKKSDPALNCVSINKVSGISHSGNWGEVWALIPKQYATCTH